MGAHVIRGLCGLAILQLMGCGTYVPAIEEFWDDKNAGQLTAGGVLEFKIKQLVYCDILEAVINARRQNYLPRGWAVQVTLDLQADETGALNPGATFLRPLSGADTFTFGLGGTLSSQGTREDKFGVYWNLDKLTSLTGTPCETKDDPAHGSSLLLESDLRIKQWLYDALYVDYFTPSSAMTKDADGAFKQEYLSYHVKFVVISSGTATPTWKLARFTSGNGNLPLFGLNRTRTHDLLMTFGPAFKAGTPNFAINSHAAQELGIATSNGNRTIFAPLPSP
jgi:hypothetical protein